MWSGAPYTVKEDGGKERGRDGWMRDNCIRKKRRLKGRKWLEEKGLISNRGGETEEGTGGRGGFTYCPPFNTYWHPLCVSIHNVCVWVCVCFCVGWWKSVNPGIPMYCLSFSSNNQVKLFFHPCISGTSMLSSVMIKGKHLFILMTCSSL